MDNDFATDEERQAAVDKYASDDIEFDDQSKISRPEGGDIGYWVAAWVWIQEEDKCTSFST